MLSIPLISTTALAGIPDFIEAAESTKALAKVFNSVELSQSIIHVQGRYIPQRSFINLMEQAGRTIGDRNFGLSLAPHLSVDSWGALGEYIGSARSMLGAALRARSALPFHGSEDRIDIVPNGEELIFYYEIPSPGLVGYRHYAVSAAMYIVTIVKPFAPAGWRPLRIELDIPRPHDAALYEDCFQSPVWFDRPRLAVVLDRSTQASERSHDRRMSRDLTLSDLRRILRSPAPTAFPDIVSELIHSHLLDGHIDIDRIAGQLGVGVRTFQRRLADENLVFRDLVLNVRAERASELLRETDAPITDIAISLGYSSPAHFARAFKRAFNRTPGEMRRLGLHLST